MQYFLVLILLSLVCLASLQSPNCFQSITITGLSNSCGRTDQSDSESNATAQWRCYDLQSALVAAVELSGFENLAENQQNTSNCVSIAVPAGDHLVTGPVHFGAASVYMFGSGERSEDVSISCNYTVDVDESRIFDLDYNYTDYTFYFNRSEVVSFEMVQFVGCPYPLRLDTVAAVRIHNSTFRNFTEAVFDIFNSAEVSITNSVFNDNSGTGISRYSFRANTGAVSTGYNNIPTLFPQVSLEVTECNFTNNRATALRQVRSTNVAFFSRIFTGRGGAVGVFYNESYYNITVRISDNHFERNFARSFGGAVYLVMFGEGTQNINILERNVFISNFALLGGGAIISTFFSNGVVGRPHSTFISDCTFIGNVGQTGGALFIYPAYESFGVSFVQCKQCAFTNNQGINSRDEYGAAVAIYLVNQFRSRESAPRYEFIDCTFEENSGNNGIFTVAYSPLSFNGTNKFIGNKKTDALRIIGSLVNFLGEMQFINNTDDNAVAMHLLSFGQARLFSGLRMIFWGNKGTFGSSILVDSQSTAFDQLAFNPQCFAVYEDPSIPPGKWNNVSVSFQRNRAILGSSLLISRLESCSWVSTNADPAFNITYFYDWPIWNIRNDSINTGYVDPYNPEHAVVTSVNTFGTANQSVRAWPGQKLQLELTGWDQFFRPTTGNARLSFVSQIQGLTVRFNPQVVVIDASGQNATLIRDFTLTYSISSGDVLTDNSSLGTATIDETLTQNIVVTPAKFTLYSALCPAGYGLVPTGEQQGGLECQCEQNNRLIINCEDNQDLVLVEEGYWGAAILDRPNYRYDLFLYPCPPGYCKCSQNTSLGPSSCAFTYINSDPDAQCACSRQGNLCGECRDGRGVSVLLNNCVTCNNAQGLLILALITADVIALIAIVIVDLPLPGWIHPFIFYIQVVPAVVIYFPESFIKGGKFLHFISSALGFYFVYDFCLYSNMSPLVSYFIRYLPALVALILSPGIFIAREKKIRTLRHHGVWLIILLLYTHLVHTSMSILECPFILDYDFPRWFVNGNIGCFTGGHIPLALLAIAVLVITVLLIPVIGLISLKRRLIKSFYWLKYFEDPLTISYKEKWRWWSAVELARRFLFILFVIPFPRNSIPPLLVLCIIVVVYGYVQPYKDRTANIAEIVVQMIFILLLALESTSFLRDTYNVFPPSQVQTMNRTDICKDDLTGVSLLTALLLPFYYLPLLLLVVLAIIKLILFIRIKQMAETISRVRRATTIYTNNAVTTTELNFEISNEYVKLSSL